MKIVKYTPVRTTKDIKGYTVNCYVTFEDGEKKRLRKRIKKDSLSIEIESLEKFLKQRLKSVSEK